MQHRQLSISLSLSVFFPLHSFHLFSIPFVLYSVQQASKQQTPNPITYFAHFILLNQIDSMHCATIKIPFAIKNIQFSIGIVYFICFECVLCDRYLYGNVRVCECVAKVWYPQFYNGFSTVWPGGWRKMKQRKKRRGRQRWRKKEKKKSYPKTNFNAPNFFSFCVRFATYF